MTGIDPCGGHVCDACTSCLRGRCCRRDNPDYRLPAFREWAGPIVGQFGVLRDDGERVMCHICGEFFGHLGGHIGRAHDLTAREYKAIFGLKMKTPLNGPATLEKHRRGADHLREYDHLKVGVKALTSEQISEFGSKRRISFQSVMERRADEGHSCAACGARFCDLPGNYRRVYCDEACRAEAYSLDWRASIKAARRVGREPEECAICGALYCTLGAYRRATCSDECHLERRRRIPRAHTPEARQKLSVAASRRTLIRDSHGRIVTWVHPG